MKYEVCMCIRVSMHVCMCFVCANIFARLVAVLNCVTQTYIYRRVVESNPRWLVESTTNCTDTLHFACRNAKLVGSSTRRL